MAFRVGADSIFRVSLSRSQIAILTSIQIVCVFCFSVVVSRFLNFDFIAHRARAHILISCICV